MSQFFNSPEAVLSPECVLINTFTYIINELVDVPSDSAKLGIPTAYVTDDGEELIGKLLQVSNNRLRLYGSARELMENVKIFKNTPGSSRYSDAHGYLLYPYYTTPVIYKSLKDEDYICKQDSYLILQNMTLEAYPFEKPQVLRVLIAIFLRFQELENLKNAEFLKFDQKSFDQINEEIKEPMKHFITDPSEFCLLMFHLSECGFPQLLEKFKSLIPIKWRDSDARFFEKVLARYFREFSDAPNFGKLLTILYSTTGELVKILKKIIDSRGEIFKTGGSQITVRLFEDGDDRFVMKAELMDAISRSKKTKMSYKDEGIIVDTISMEDVEKNYGDQVKNLEFIRTPILRVKHNSVPVQVGLEYCVLAVDAIFDVMKSIIFGLKLYQKYQNPSSKDESDGFRLLESGFDPNRKSKFFITIKGLAHLQTMFDMMAGCYSLLPAKDVRNAKKDGFSIQNLKNELAHLNLTHAFPEIQSFADVVYSEVDKRKKGPVLRTCDLFDAIEQCELASLFHRLPNFRKFLHNQKGCHRIYALKCERCEIEDRLKRQAEIRKAESSKSSQKASEVQKTMENLKIRDEKLGSSESQNPDLKTLEVVSNNENEKAPEHPTTTTITPPESPIEKKPGASPSTLNTPKQMASKAAPGSKPSSESQSQKTSANCEKCYRACEMLNETKKELKSSENKLKNVEKKMLGKEKEMEELKKKMDEKDKQIQGLNDQVFSLQSSMSQTEKESYKQKETFQSAQKLLEEQVARLGEELQMRLKEMQGLEKRIQEEEEKNQKLSGHISDVESYMVHNQVEQEKRLEEKVLRLEQELRRGNENMWELQNQMASEETQFEAVIQEKNRIIEELKESEIRMKAENEVNQRMIQQLMDKLASSGVSHTPGFRRTSEVSTTSSRIQKCEICWNETNDRETVRCQKCRRPFHQNCSSQWLKIYKNCPSCEEEFIESNNNHFS